MSKRKYVRSRSRLRTLGLIAGALAATALIVREMAKAAEKKHPPEGNFVTVDGVRLHYTDTGGEGTPVVLLHGNGMTSADWRISGVTKALALRYRVIAFDRPGFGYSERPRSRTWTPQAQADIIKAALAEIGVSQPVVVGHSFGALVAAAYAIKHRRFVRGVVLVSGYYFPTFRADSLIFSPPAIPVLGDILRYTISPIIGLIAGPLLFKKSFAPREIPERFSREFPLALALRPWQILATSADAAMMVEAAAQLEDTYRSISVPTAIVSGDADEITDLRRQSFRLHTRVPASKMRIHAGIGHMVHYFAPNAIINAIDTVSVGSRDYYWRRELGRI
jgi:pimeloyl-ACP methyl ester carboxylesterase